MALARIDSEKRKSVEELIQQLNIEFEETKKKINELKNKNDLFFTLCEMLMGRLDDGFDGLDDPDMFDAFEAYIKSLINTMRQYKTLFVIAKNIADKKEKLKPELLTFERDDLKRQLAQTQAELKATSSLFLAESTKHIQASLQLSGKQNSTQLFICIGAAVAGVMLLGVCGIFAASGVGLPVSPILALVGLELLAGAVGIAFELSMFAVGLAVVGGIFAYKARQQGLSKEATNVATIMKNDVDQLVTTLGA